MMWQLAWLCTHIPGVSIPRAREEGQYSRRAVSGREAGWSSEKQGGASDRREL